MGEFIDKATDEANEATGKARVAADQKTDNSKMIIKGAEQQSKGKAQKVVGTFKGVLGDKL